MSHIARTIAGLAIAAAISSPVAAQGVVTQKSISLPMAQAIANAVIAKCQSMGFKISVSVLDRGGLALVMLRDEGASLHTVESSDRKAYTARTFRQPSSAWAKRTETVNQGQRMLADVIPLGGGMPINIGEETIGGVGLSGAPGGQEQEEACAKAGIAKVADQLK